MTTRKTTPATAEAAAEPPAEAKKPRTPRKPAAKTTAARSTAKTTTARKTPAKAPATEAKKPRAKKPAAAAWADLYSTEPTAPAEPTAPTPAPTPAAAPAPAKPEPPVVEMTVTPIRGFARPKRHQLSFRMPTDIPPLLTEAQQLLFEQGRGQSRDLIVAEAIRQWVERERAAVARAKAKAKDPEADA